MARASVVRQARLFLIGALTFAARGNGSLPGHSTGRTSSGNQPMLCCRSLRRAVLVWSGPGSPRRGRTRYLFVPILLLPTVLGRREDAPLGVATFAGAISALLALIGFLRWVFVVPPLARMYQESDIANRAAVAAAWLAQHQYGGALIGEHLGQLLGVGWSITLSIIILRTRVLPRWLGLVGLIVSILYLFNQGDIMATAFPGLSGFRSCRAHR